MQNIFLLEKESQVLSSYFHVVLSFIKICLKPPSHLGHSTYKIDLLCTKLQLIRTYLLQAIYSFLMPRPADPQNTEFLSTCCR